MAERIKIIQDLSIEHLQKLYSKLYSLDKKRIDILLPKSIKENNFGSLPLLIQFISTWLRITETGNLVVPIDIKKDSQEVIEDYFKQYFVYVSYQMGQKYRDVVDVNGRSVIPLIDGAINLVAELMKKERGPKRNSIMLSCFDHLPEDEGGLLPAFYEKGEFIKNELAHNYLGKLISFIDIYSRDLIKNAIEKDKKELTAIIYELIKNTDDWARKDVQNNILYPNVRGLYLKMHKNDQASYVESAYEFEGLKKYLAHDNFLAKAGDELYFLELTVFDSGPGYVNRYTGRNELFELDEQINIVKKCLIRNNTSERSVGKDYRGIGLDRVLATLDKKGFLMIKTGGVFIYRDLIKDQYVHTKEIKNVMLYDIKKDLKESFSTNWPVAGSVITIIFPLNDLV